MTAEVLFGPRLVPAAYRPLGLVELSRPGSVEDSLPVCSLTRTANGLLFSMTEKLPFIQKEGGEATLKSGLLLDVALL